MIRPTKNMAASVGAKLLNLSRETGQSFQELVQYFAMTRFLYRLAQSTASSQFILKGAMLLHAMNITQARSTLDIDLLGETSNSLENIRETLNTVIDIEVDDDGLKFLKETIVISDIDKDGDYFGRRAKFRAKLGRMDIPMQIDIGIGDSVVPDPLEISTPAMLGYPSGTLRGYALETSVAEKTQAMLQLEMMNSRMKDFYDIWLLSQTGQLNEADLVRAIHATFNKRKLEIHFGSIVFSDVFLNCPEKQAQWAAFCRKRGIEDVPDTFAEVAGEVLRFLHPHLKAASQM
jgi:predicted nucleotidyltransferase component of viral defense system